MKKDNKRITFLIGSMRRGGAERVISILANNYIKKGWNVDIITLLDDSNDYNLDNRVNIMPICQVSKSKLYQLPSWIFNIRKHVKENNPDIIVSFIARINIITILSCIGLNKKIIISERNDPKADGRGFLVKILTYMLYPLTNSIIFQTEWAKSCFPKYIQDKGIIIGNPVNVSTDKKELGTKKIVAVGRLTEQKNHEMLINAFKKINDYSKEYKLYIYGEGGLREKLEEQVGNLKLQEYVFLPGNFEDIHERISDADIFVLSSRYEGLSNALLEAMMIGIPCISTDCAGANEVIENGYNGILIPNEDEGELIKAIKQIINDSKKMKKLSVNAKKSVELFKSENILTKWEKVIEKTY